MDKPILGLVVPIHEGGRRRAASAGAAARGGRIRPLLAGSGVHGTGSNLWRRRRSACVPKEGVLGWLGAAPPAEGERAPPRLHSRYCCLRSRAAPPRYCRQAAEMKVSEGRELRWERERRGWEREE